MRGLLQLLLPCLFVHRFGRPAKALSTPPFRLVTWNILAPLYAPHKKYPWTDPFSLEWSNRKPRIIEMIEQSQADIVCLQEVQMDLWPDFYRGQLESNYTGLVQNMTCQHPVGCAVLVHKDSKLKVVETESRSRALIVVLEHELGQRLYMAVVHLEAGIDKEETRWNQLKSLLKRLHHHTEQEENEPAVVLAGDFNTYLRSSPLFSVLGGSPCSDKLQWKGLSHFVEGSASVPDMPPWKALLPLMNVHQDNRPSLTYCGGSVLDYIWVSKNSIKVHEALTEWSPTDSEDYNNKEDYEDELRPQQPWPSAGNPSDHVPIGALISLEQPSNVARRADLKTVNVPDKSPQKRWMPWL